MKRLKISIFVMQYIHFKKCTPQRLKWSEEPQAFVEHETKVNDLEVLKSPEVLNDRGTYLKEKSVKICPNNMILFY